MRPLHAIAGGLVLITLDFRTIAVDLLPDVLGWLLILWAGQRLASTSIRVVAVIGALASVAVFSLPYHLVQFNPMTNETVVVTPGNDLGYAETIAFDPLSGWRLLGFTVGVASVGAIVVLVERHLRGRARSWPGPSVDTSLRRIRVTTWAVVGLWVTPRLVAVAISGTAGYEPIWRDPAARLAVIGVVAAVTHAVVLVLDAREPWADTRTQTPVAEPAA